MELRRKCEDTIKQWYKKSKKALLIKGARQVGKTHIIRSVLDSVDCEYVEINLIEMPAVVFSGYNVSVSEKITYLPIYMVMFFDKDGEDMVLPRISFTE